MNIIISIMSISMFVTKRDGHSEAVNFDKIYKRLQTLGESEHEYPLQINYHTLAMKLIDQLYDGIPTSKLDELGAEQCASLITTHFDYGILASLLLCSNHQEVLPWTSDSQHHQSLYLENLILELLSLRVHLLAVL